MRLSPCPLGVTTVSPPATGLTVVRILHAPLNLRAHLMGPSVNLWFSMWASLPHRGLGTEVSQWGWSHSCCRGHHGRSSPTDTGVSRIKGRVRLMPAVGKGEVFGRLAAAVSVRTVEAEPIIRILSTPSKVSCRGGSRGRAVTVACLPATSSCHCTASCSMQVG
jgi:hypothetical protein